MSAGLANGGFELHQVCIEVPQDPPLQRFSRVAQRLPVGPLVDHTCPLLADRLRRDGEVLPELRVAQRFMRGRWKVGGHTASVARISARCAVRTPERIRESAPPMWSRHELSSAVHTSASVSRTLRTLSARIAADVSAFLMANVPPKPQHSAA